MADLTQQRTDQGWWYRAVVLDCCSRRIVGWSMADHLGTELVLDALDMASSQRQPAPAWCITPITAARTPAWCSAGGCVSRPGRLDGHRGDALDNAVAESFYATLEGELLDRQARPTRAGCARRCSTSSRSSTTVNAATPPSATSHPSATSSSTHHQHLPQSQPVHDSGATPVRHI